MPNAALAPAEQSVGGLLTTLPGSRCKALGTLQRPSLLASRHLLLPQALAISHCLVPACCLHAPPVLCAPLADRFASSPDEASSPQGHSPSAKGRDQHQTPWPGTDLPDSTTPPLSHLESSNGTGLGCRGLTGLTHSSPCQHCHVSCVLMTGSERFPCSLPLTNPTAPTL